MVNKTERKLMQFRFTVQDEKNLEKVQERLDCVSKNEAVRQALKVVAGSC